AFTIPQAKSNEAFVTGNARHQPFVTDFPGENVALVSECCRPFIVASSRRHVTQVSKYQADEPLVPQRTSQGQALLPQYPSSFIVALGHLSHDAQPREEVWLLFLVSNLTADPEAFL